MSSPTSRSKQHLEAAGYLVGVVEKWVQFPPPGHRVDLFGILDLVAVKDRETIGVQTTSGSNVSARIKKLEDSAALWMLRQAGWRIVVHGWRKARGRWQLRVEDIS